MAVQLVEEIDDRLLVGIGHVDAGETKPPHAIQNFAQGLAAGTRDLDELIMAMQAERLGCLLMHRGRGRMRDRRADQADEKVFAGCRSFRRRGPWFVLGRSLQISQHHVADLLPASFHYVDLGRPAAVIREQPERRPNAGPDR